MIFENIVGKEGTASKIVLDRGQNSVATLPNTDNSAADSFQNIVGNERDGFPCYLHIHPVVQWYMYLSLSFTLSNNVFNTPLSCIDLPIT